MKTILLTASIGEATAYAREAGLRAGEAIIVSSGAPAAQSNLRRTYLLRGVRLTEDDLVAEFPGFRDGPYAAECLEAVKVLTRTADGAGPAWEQITGGRST